MQKDKNTIYHLSVLTNEVLDYLNVKPQGLYLDATFGGGGHTRAILEKEKTAKVIALDWDKTAIEKNAPPLEKEFGNRFKAIWGNFGHLYRILMKKAPRSFDTLSFAKATESTPAVAQRLWPARQGDRRPKFDGILADFGTSQFQIHHQKGFSFAKDTPLDMRMSPAHFYFTAQDVVNRHSEKSLTNLFREFGEERHARLIAKAIVKHRAEHPLETTRQLAALIEKVVPFNPRIRKRIHPATRVFQALRIYVNKELENIEQFLKAVPQFLQPGGRIVCISFHSLEDRIVKNFFLENQELLNILTKKPLIAARKELAQNHSSRSAKLRAAEKK